MLRIYSEYDSKEIYANIKDINLEKISSKDVVSIKLNDIKMNELFINRGLFNDQIIIFEVSCAGEKSIVWIEYPNYPSTSKTAKLILMSNINDELSNIFEDIMKALVEENEDINKISISLRSSNIIESKRKYLEKIGFETEIQLDDEFENGDSLIVLSKYLGR